MAFLYVVASVESSISIAAFRKHPFENWNTIKDEQFNHVRVHIVRKLYIHTLSKEATVFEKVFLEYTHNTLKYTYVGTYTCTCTTVQF